MKGMVGATGFEPVTTRTPSVCATRLRYAPTMLFNRKKCITASRVNQFTGAGGNDSLRGFPTLFEMTKRFSLRHSFDHSKDASTPWV
jgi:hypothetical protein